jgi:hypothetical protein
VVIILFDVVSRAVICSTVLCEWLLYCSCVVMRIQLYVAQCYVSGYYIAICVIIRMQLYIAKYHLNSFILLVCRH